MAAVLMILIVAVGIVRTTSSGTAVHAATQSEDVLSLQAPWSFVTATESGAPEALLGDIVGIEATFRWNPVNETFDTWRPASPAFLNSLETIEAGDALWLLMSAPSAWTRPLFIGQRPVTVIDVWSTLGWTGPDIAVEDVAALLDADRVVAFVASGFLVFDPRLPSALNSLTDVRRGDPLWILSTGSRTATIPTAAPTAPREAAPPPPQNNCHPSYRTVCIPPPPPDLNCGDIPFRGFAVIGADPHRFDTDLDGVGCES